MYQDHVFFQETYTQSWSTSRGISSMVLIPIQLSAALSGFYRGTPILKQFTSVAMFVDQPKLGTVWSHRFVGTERVTLIDMQYSFWTWKSKLGYLQKKIRYCSSSKKNQMTKPCQFGWKPWYPSVHFQIRARMCACSFVPNKWYFQPHVVPLVNKNLRPLFAIGSISRRFVWKCTPKSNGYHMSSSSSSSLSYIHNIYIYIYIHSKNTSHGISHSQSGAPQNTMVTIIFPNKNCPSQSIPHFGTKQFLR